MMEDAIGFQRGQVWFKKVDGKQQSDLEDNKHLAKKDRPYLIISDNEENLISPTINCVPIITEVAESKRYKNDVPYKYRERNCLVRCCQIYTFDKASFNNRESGSGYMYTLSEKILNKVDLSLVSQMNLYKNAYDLTTLYTIVDKIVKQKEVELQKKYTEVNMSMIQKIADRVDDILKLNVDYDIDANNLLDVNDDVVEEIIDDVQDIQLDTTIDVGRQKRKYSKSKDTNKSKKSKKSKVNILENNVVERKAKWGIEKEEEFLADYEKLTQEEMLVKYSINTITALYSKKYSLLKRHLRRMSERVI